MGNRIVSLVNLLTLLKDEPKRKTELFETGVFRNRIDLTLTIRRAKQAGLISLDRIEHEDYDIEWRRRPVHRWYALTDLGLRMLDYYNRNKEWEIRTWGVKNYCGYQPLP